MMEDYEVKKVKKMLEISLAEHLWQDVGRAIESALQGVPDEEVGDREAEILGYALVEWAYEELNRG